MKKSENLFEIYSAYKNENPDKILAETEKFFVKEGILFKRGLLSEKEYYINTNPGALHTILWRMKYDLKVNQYRLNMDGDFRMSFEKWKESGYIVIKPWMKEALTYHHGNLSDAVGWFFKVIDGYKVPLGLFEALVIHDKTKYPKVAARVGYDYVYPYLTEKCLNIRDLLDDPDPIGKEYVFSFD